MDYHTTLTVLQRDTNVHKVLTKERRVAGERRWQEKGGGRRKEVAGERRWQEKGEWQETIRFKLKGELIT